jgi:formate hydrogenlyase transcriptional activator
MLARASAVDPIDPADYSPWASVPAADRRVAAVGSQLGVLRLIGDLASRLVAVEPDAIDETLVDSLRQVAEVLQLDRAIVWRQAKGEMSALASHYWIKPPQLAAPELFPLAAGPFIASKLEAGEAIWFTRVDDVPDPVAREALARHGFRSAAFVPVLLTGAAPGVRGVLAAGSTTAAHEWTPATIEQLRLVSGVFSQALARKASQQALRQALDELHRLRERMPEEDVQDHLGVKVVQASRLRGQLPANRHVPRKVPEQFGDGRIIGRSPALGRVLEQLRQVAATSSTVLLRGETGTGKELLATHLHELSARCRQEMVRVNCSAIPSTLLESELFGREKGAFTGALARQVGRFELADHSTIFLDEIGDLPADVQVKLLRVLEERQIERLGSPKRIRVDVRIVAATHRNLEKRIADETFREDLFYRLNVFPIQVPPLRERAEDIPLLVWRFVAEFGKSFAKRIDAIPRDNMSALQQYAWPGNIRELRNVVERAMIVATGTELTIALPAPSGPTGQRSVSMSDVAKEHILRVLESSHWRIRGSGGAAERLGLRPTTLETRMAKLGLSRPRHAARRAH